MNRADNVMFFVDIAVSFVLPTLLIGISIYRMVSRRLKKDNLSIVDSTTGEINGQK